MKNKRALSPIIATILLIVITIAAALILWTMMSSFGRTGTSSGVSIITASAQLQPDGKTLVLKIAVRNTGTTLLQGNITVEIGNGNTYYFDSSGSQLSTTTPSGPISIPAGQTIENTAYVTLTSSPPQSVKFTAKFSDPSGKIVQDIKAVNVEMG
jgi:flagellin-like protein